MLGLVLLYVGAVLCINGLAMLGHIHTREAAIMNIFTGVVAGAVAIYSAFVEASSAGVEAAAYGLLFAFTYFWVAYNTLTQQDGRGLGWFSLFVAVTAVGVTVNIFAVADSFHSYWMAFNWAAWAVLWFGFFLIGARGKSHLVRPVATLAIAEGIVTAWLPGYLLLSGHMPT